jgi:hypothetical protein
VASFQSVPIPAPILEHHSEVTLCVDFFFVQGQAFLHTISRKLQYRLVTPVNDRTKTTMLKCINSSLLLYRTRGFTVVDIHADLEFECIREDIMPVHLNVLAADAHVGEVERSIRTIKERNRATVHGLPFKRLPKIMVREIVKHSVTCLNQLPANDGLSEHLSPLSIMTGKSNPDFNHMRIEFGSYAQIFEPTTFASNTLRSRTTGAIALTATGKAQGDFHFMSLITGRRLSRHQWTPVPMTDAAIDRVEQIASEEDQPWVQNTGLLVEWRPNEPFDDDDDPDYVYEEDVNEDEYEDDEYDDSLSNEPTVSTNNVSNAHPGSTSGIEVETISPDTSIDTSVDSGYEDDFDAEDVGVPQSNLGLVDQNQEDVDAHAPEVPLPRYELRPSRGRSYVHRLDHQMDESDDPKSYLQPTQLLQKSTNQIVTAYIMTQMSAASGIKTYGQPAVDAILKEFCQLHDKGVFEPQLATSLTAQQKRSSLRAVNLIKEKRNGDIKGRTCADGSTQRSLYDKSETTSPTIANDALMYSLIIDAKERRDVATADVVGAYLNADMDAIGIMIQVNKNYEFFATTENGKPVLYLQLKKAGTTCLLTPSKTWVLHSILTMDAWQTKSSMVLNVPLFGTWTITRYPTWIQKSSRTSLARSRNDSEK